MPSAPFTVIAGGSSVTWTGGNTNVGTLTSSVDRAVVSWHPGNFTIQAGDTFNFNLPSNASVILNKVGYGTNGTTVGATDNAVINGNLFSNGRVIVLANGSISVGAGAQINTQGLVLSTLLEPDHNTFTASGNLALTGAPAGGSTITIGGPVPPSPAPLGTASIGGSVAAYSGSIGLDNLSVSGDVIVNSRTGGLTLSGNNGAVGGTNIVGNLTATTNNMGISQGTSSLTVLGNQTTINTNGAATVTLANPTNNFNTVTANVGSLSLGDSNSIVLGNSTIAGSLVVTAANDISTGGTVAVTQNVNLNSTSAGNINFAHNSTVGGTFNASVLSGNITVATAGSLTLGTITGPSGADSSIVGITIGSAGTGYTSAPSVTITGGGGTGATATAIVNTTTGVVTGVTITTPGSGYTSAPTINLAGGTGSPTTPATATAVVISPVATGAATVTDAGAGFTSAPTVTFVGGGGSGLVATATFDTNTGTISAINVTSGGTGFTSAPSITVSGGGSSAPALATTTLNPSGGVGQVTLTNPGVGYVSVPTVTFSGGAGSGATATAAIGGGVVTGVTTTASGSGFTSPPTVVFGGGGGAQASLSPILSLLGGSVINISTPGTMLITGAVSGSSVTIQGSSINATSGGSVTSGGPSVFTATSGSVVLPTATASRFEVTATGGSISQFGSSILSTNASGTNSRFNAGTNGSISLANANALTGAVVQLTGTTATVNNTTNLAIGATTLSGNLNVNTTQSAPGAGEVMFGADSGSAAQDINIGGSVSISTNNSDITEGSATTSNVFGSITLSTIPAGTFGGVALAVGSGGSGYTSAPSVTITGGGGTGATAIALVNTTTGQVTGFTITNPGTGFRGTGTGLTGMPTVTFLGGGGTGASATTFTGGNISFRAAELAQGGGGRYGQFIIPAAKDVTLSENTTLNVGTLTGRSVTLNSVSSDILINGTINAANTVSANANSASIIEGASGAIISVGNVDFRSSNSFGTNLSSSANSFGGSVRFINGRDNIVVASSNITLAANNSVTAANSSVTVQTVGGANNTITTNGNIQRLIANSSGNIVVNGGIHNTLLTLTANDPSATSITQTNGIVEMGGVMTLKSSGNIALNNVGNNLTGSVVLDNTVGDVAVSSARNLTIRGNANGNLTAVAGSSTTNSFANPWGITLGNLNVRSLNALASNGGSVVGGLPSNAVTVTSGGTGYTAIPTVTIVGGGSGATATATVSSGVVTGVTITGAGLNYFTAPTIVFGTNVAGATGAAGTVTAAPFGVTTNVNAGSSGSIVQQSGTRLHVENLVNLVTINGGVLLNNNGNNFGRIQSSSGGATGLIGTGNITIVEDPTMKVGLIATSGNVSLTSRFGSVIEDSVENVMITANGTGTTLTLAAPNGSVQLGGLNRTSGTTTGNITGANITATGAAQLLTSGNLTLGAMSANSLAITANNIDQSGPLNIFGLSSFTATNNITLTNTNNNFGPLSLTTMTSNGSIAVSEGSTLNLRGVSMPGGGNGTFTATSGSGDIVDTGLGGSLGGVRLGGGIIGTSVINGQGIVSLSAVNGNIILEDPTTDVLTSAGLVLNAQNVTISVLGSPGSNLILGAAATPSAVSGNLTASTILGNIGNAGPLTVGGTAAFQAVNGNITITQTGVGFGAVRFKGNQVSIYEGGNMDILTDSSAFGIADLRSGGSISVTEAGAGTTVTFGNTVSMNATGAGNITLKLVQAVGNLTVTANGTKDLSALSLSTDLNSRAPIFQGAGPNIEPKP